jgi:uncharacterized repeat protein (TIGR01451 family)/LPXTG-motif cell wall-anchored protein
MRYVRRDGRSMRTRRNDGTRAVALVATFLLLMAGVVVSAPGLMASASGSSATSGHNGGSDVGDDEQQDDGEDDGEDHHGHHHDGECENEDEDGSQDEDAAHDESSTSSDDETSTTVKDHEDEGDEDEADGECEATIEFHKVLGNDRGGILAPEDFQLRLDGEAHDQLIDIPVTPDVVHTITEDPVFGYTLRVVLCFDVDSNEQISVSGTVIPSAGQHISCEVVNDEIDPTITVQKEVITDNGGSAEPQDFRLTIDNVAVAQDTPIAVVANQPSVVSEDEEDTVQGYATKSIECTSNIADSPNTKSVEDTGAIDVTPVLGENILCVVTNDDIAAGLTVEKVLKLNHGGNEVSGDFSLQVNGLDVSSGTLVTYEPEVDLAITETQRSGYVASNINCSSSDPESTNNIDTDYPDDTTTLATVVLVQGESVICKITNEDIAPTVEVHKVVAVGDKPASQFQMTLADDNVDQNTPYDTLANTPIEVSEEADADYIKTSVVCTDNDDDGAPLAHPLVLTEGQNATCTVTNTRKPATITVVKTVTKSFGGTLNAADFQLRIDGFDVTQGAPSHEVAVGAHTISELGRAGYRQAGIECVDIAMDEIIGEGGAINVVAGQDVECTVSNVDIAPTLTLVKHVNSDAGGTLPPSAFHLRIDDAAVPQNQPQPLRVGNHTISEDAVTGYRLVAIDCTDNATDEPVTYDNGVSLVLDQDVTCVVTNQRDRLDLAISKTVEGGTKIAGGPSFSYTINVDNLGPRDAESTDVVKVTDQLPVGLAFVSPLPAGCTVAGNRLTCDIDSADLQVADPPVVIIVTVKALADAPSGTYRNVALVDTAFDPSCVGYDCMPTCDDESNNVACVDTEVRRESSIAIVKVDNVDDAIHPGGTYSYGITVTNDGPSSFLPNLKMTDELPDSLAFVSINAPSPWTCETSTAIVCTFGESLPPGVSTPTITITVRLGADSLDNSVTNQAQAIASVDPGNTVTATDSETTPVVRTADVSIDKSAQTGAAVVGQNFDWTILVTNHGPDTATGVVVNDTMPQQFTMSSVTTSAGSCVTSAQTVQCNLPNMAKSATVAITIHTTVATASASPVINTATVSTTSTDPVPENNTDDAQVPGVLIASSPPVPVPDAAVAAELPRTGGSPTGPLTLATLLLGGGIVSLVIARRRRAASA